ncbi:MAG: DUF1643 domain-containing protein [Anaerovoracaceae bacterium]
MQWLYEKTEDNSARFILGTVGENPLLCFGINPSTAEPNNLDPTVNLVSRQASANGYDSFIMLNVYAQRGTNPNDLDSNFSQILKEENESQIATLINRKNFTIWAAWGALIEKRAYLPLLIRDIVMLPELNNVEWVSRGPLTKSGHPHHPLYLKKDAMFEPFDIEHYFRLYL